jgi:hypothetical protein
MVHKLNKNKSLLLSAFLCVVVLVVALFPQNVLAAGPSEDTVRVGYYEQEVFQEGAADGAVKTGYAYEYYQKLSEYAGWRYEYVYGEFGDLYQMLMDGDIDLFINAWLRAGGTTTRNKNYQLDEDE